MDEPLDPPDSTQAQIARLVVYESQVPASQPSHAHAAATALVEEDDVVDEDIIDIDDALVPEQPHREQVMARNAAQTSDDFYDGDAGTHAPNAPFYLKGSSRAQGDRQHVRAYPSRTAAERCPFFCKIGLASSVHLHHMKDSRFHISLEKHGYIPL